MLITVRITKGGLPGGVAGKTLVAKPDGLGSVP